MTFKMIKITYWKESFLITFSWHKTLHIFKLSQIHFRSKYFQSHIVSSFVISKKAKIAYLYAAVAAGCQSWVTSRIQLECIYTVNVWNLDVWSLKFRVFSFQTCLKNKQKCPDFGRFTKMFEILKKSLNFRHMLTNNVSEWKLNFFETKQFWVSEIHTSLDFRHLLYAPFWASKGHLVPSHGCTSHTTPL